MPFRLLFLGEDRRPDSSASAALILPYFPVHCKCRDDSAADFHGMQKDREQKSLSVFARSDVTRAAYSFPRFS